MHRNAAKAIEELYAHDLPLTMQTWLIIMTKRKMPSTLLIMPGWQVKARWQSAILVKP